MLVVILDGFHETERQVERRGRRRNSGRSGRSASRSPVAGLISVHALLIGSASEDHSVRRAHREAVIEIAGRFAGQDRPRLPDRASRAADEPAPIQVRKSPTDIYNVPSGAKAMLTKYLPVSPINVAAPVVGLMV